MKLVPTALAGAVAVAFTQLAIAQGASPSGDYEKQQQYPQQQNQQYPQQQNQQYGQQANRQYDSSSYGETRERDRDRRDNSGPGNARDRDRDHERRGRRGGDDDQREGK